MANKKPAVKRVQIVTPKQATKFINDMLLTVADAHHMQSSEGVVDSIEMCLKDMKVQLLETYENKESGDVKHVGPRVQVIEKK